MSYKWAYTYCDNVSYYIKGDDDVLINNYLVQDFLYNLNKNTFSG